MIYIFSSCTEEFTTNVPERLSDDRIESGQNVYLIDRQGQRWDITHAVEKYGFRAENFQYGLGKNAIPSIDYPDMYLPGEPGYPLPDDRATVVAARIRSEARAYPLFIMKFHEIVNESFAGELVAVAYWPIVKLTAVYSREIDGKELTLSASGWTYNNTFVLFDRQTESLWYHLEGTDELTCVNGFYKDQTLDEYPSVSGRWNIWFTDNPDSKYLKYDPDKINDRD